MGRILLGAIGLALAAWHAPIPAAHALLPARRPNIVIIVADDLGYADLGFQGCKDIPTPHLDLLARSGVRLTSGYVSAAVCSPSRAGLLTGRYQQRFGHEFNLGGVSNADPLGLPLSESTLAERLQRAGYATGAVGKWHLGREEAYHPQRRGFDEFFGFLGTWHKYVPAADAQILRGTAAVVEKEYLTDALAREAVDFIERHKARPFLLYLAFNAVHEPLEAPEATRKQFESIADPKRRLYAAVLSSMDDAIGRLIEKLRDAGLEDDTLLFFLSDNGGPVAPVTPPNGSRNEPLRGTKRTTLEGGIRVPFVVSWKGKLPAGTVYDHPVMQLDIFPTALAAAGILESGAADGAAKPLDGVNLLPHLSGARSDPPHDTLYWRLGRQMAIRRGDWKLVRYNANADASADKTDRDAITPARLYNLVEDVGEAKDLAARHPDRVRDLESAWERWNTGLAPLR